MAQVTQLGLSAVPNRASRFLYTKVEVEIVEDAIIRTISAILPVHGMPFSLSISGIFSDISDVVIRTINGIFIDVD